MSSDGLKPVLGVSIFVAENHVRNLALGQSTLLVLHELILSHSWWFHKGHHVFAILASFICARLNGLLIDVFPRCIEQRMILQRIQRIPDIIRRGIVGCCHDGLEWWEDKVTRYWNTVRVNTSVDAVRENNEK
jgi:hypothetical protein